MTVKAYKLKNNTTFDIIIDTKCFIHQADISNC